MLYFFSGFFSEKSVYPSRKQIYIHCKYIQALTQLSFQGFQKNELHQGGGSLWKKILRVHSRRLKTAYIQKLRSKSVGVGHPGGCLLHSLVFGVSLRCSKAVVHVDTVLHHVCTFLSPYHHFICVYVLSTSAWPSPASE